MNKQNITVLIVDDDPFVREMLATILQSSDYAVETADNGADALRKYSGEHDIHLIISDMNMPEMSGLEMIKKIRGAGSDVPIIILTGNNEISVAVDAMNSGANDYLLKDENIQDTVVLSVEKVMEKHLLKKQNIQLMADITLKNERLENEKLLAQKVQKNILPKQLQFSGMQVEALYKPSDKIGGDFFDAWETGRQVHFLIGDVSGHSTSSALIMAVSKGILQSLGFSIKNPIEIVSTANRMLCDILSDSGMFLSLVYGIYDREKDALNMVSAGHNPVFLVNNGAIEAIDATGPVLGWETDDTWNIFSTAFNTGARLVLYTDGLTEAKNKEGEEFGEERLKMLLGNSGSASGIVETICRELEGFSGSEFADDLTLLVLNKT